MANYRTVSISFWTDSKVDDEFTPEDKYFFLYLLTNPHTNICGCYEISMKQMERETGYNTDTVKRLIDRMQNTHKVICYCEHSKEILILNWSRYNWHGSGKVKSAVLNAANEIKCEEFKRYVIDIISIGYPYPIDRVSIGYPYDMDRVWIKDTVTDTDTDTVKNNAVFSDKPKKQDTHAEEIKQVISYLNEKTGSNYRPTTDSTKRHLNARLSEGFTVDDCKKVIDKKAQEWKGTELEKYLRPETLFGTKFESYLNQTGKTAPQKPQPQDVKVSCSSIDDELLEKIMNPYGI